VVARPGHRFVRSRIENEFHFQYGLLLALLAWPAVAHAGDEPDEPDDPALVGDEPILEIVVTATRTETPLGDSPVAVEVIDRDEIEASGAQTLDELLEEHPGMDVSRSFAGSTIRMQGLDPQQVLVLVDGQRVIGRKAGAVDLSRYPVEWIERVEIVKGPSSVLYGSDAMGGVINIITRRPTAPLSAELYGSYGTLAAVDLAAGVGVRRERVSTMFTGGFHRADAYDLDPRDVATSGSAYSGFDVGNRTELRLSPDWRVIGRGGYLFRDSRGIDTSDGGAVFDRRNLTEEGQVALGLDGWPTGRSRLQVTGYATWYRDQYDSDQRDSSALDTYEDTRERLAQLAVQYDRYLGESHLVTVGTEGLNEWMLSDRLEAGSGERWRLALFAQDEWDLSDAPRLTLLPGARLDLDTQFGVHPTPKLSARFDPVERLVIRASYGWGYRAPSFKELLLYFENPGAGYVVAGNLELVPETSRNASLGVEWEPTDWLWLSLGAFRNDLDNLITTGTLEEAEAGSPTRYGYVNVADAYTQGGEAALALGLPAGIGVDLGYALTDTRDLVEDRPLEGRALHRGTFRLTWRYEPWGTLAVLRGSLVGSRPYYLDVDGDGVEDRSDAEPYATLDARISKELWGAVSLFAGADNLLDAGDAEWTPLPPRSFYAGLTGRYPWEVRRHGAPEGGTEP